jgi:transcriptional regulator with XRE-family HTH domain
MRPDLLRQARLAAGLTQQQAARRLEISQAYLALIECGRRPVTARLALRVVELYGLGPSALPIDASRAAAWDSASLAAALGSLGYPGFRYLRGAAKDNPALVLLGAIAASEVEVRVVEALPWLVASYSDLDWPWVIRESKLRDVQNRLGFIVALGWRLAARRGDQEAESRLRLVEEALDRARLVREDTLCQASMTEAERRWLRRTRPAVAEHWNLLTDLDLAGLSHLA